MARRGEDSGGVVDDGGQGGIRMRLRLRMSM